jgi:hypothetical protein|tara:strand:- start:1593 stop:1934 length:342 start_codon:yes stop_codon:yes gene_type:complete
MKISEFTEHEQLDELSAGEVGAGLGKGVRAVGTGVKNFAKGFGQGLMGSGKEKNVAQPDTTAPKGKSTKPVAKANPGKTPGSNVMAIQQAIAKLNPKQQASIRQLAAKQAGVK